MVVMLLLFWKSGARFPPRAWWGYSPPGSPRRFTVEFFREPDAQLAEFAHNTGLSMGQWLTIPLMIVGPRPGRRGRC